MAMLIVVLPMKFIIEIVSVLVWKIKAFLLVSVDVTFRKAS